MSTVDYELLISQAGNATLTCGGEVMWTSDNDDEFAEEEDIVIDYDDDAQIDALIQWLVDHEYLPPSTDVDVVPEEEASGL